MAIQNTETIDDEGKVNKYGETKPTVILLHYPEANNFISELMVAGYEKFLAKALSYTNYDKAYADTVQQLSPYGLSSEGHSRGTLVQDNAFNILSDQGWQAPDSMSVRMRGAAVSEADANSTMNAIGITNDINHRSYFAHPNDPVNELTAGFKGNLGASIVEIPAMRGPTSAHSCYGSGAQGCVTIETPFNYESLGKTPEELNAIRNQNIFQP